MWPGAILNKMEERKLNSEQIAGVGVGVPGPVLKEREVAVAVNLHWGYTMLADDLEGLLGGGIPRKGGKMMPMWQLWERCGKAAAKVTAA